LTLLFLLRPYSVWPVQPATGLLRQLATAPAMAKRTGTSATAFFIVFLLNDMIFLFRPFWCPQVNRHPTAPD